MQYQYFIIFLIGYLIGSILFGVIVGRCKGVDIFKVGSGNPGATNIKRTLGALYGRLVFFLDSLKGVIAASLPYIFYKGNTDLAIICFCGAIAGHCFSCFHKFKGGKAVATTIGGLLVLAPWSVCIGLSIWLVFFYSTRYVSVASMMFGLSLPISGLVLREESSIIKLSFIIMIVILCMHKKNIKRLWNGIEDKH